MAGSLIGALRVTLGIDTAAFEDGLDIAQKRVSKAGKELAKTGDKITSIGKKMSLGVTLPLGAFGVASFKAASDAAELQSAFDQTFGEMSKDMTDWAVSTGDAMGRSTQSLQQAANTFGIFFNQAAETREEAAEMSKIFTVLSQDLASFYNVTESDALAKLRSGLSGESEPLRDFGVFLTAATVEAKAMEMGLGSLNGELSEQDKIMARYALILDKTQNAQGDVARTSQGTANQMRAAKAAFEELQVTVGTKLLPVLTPLIEKLAGVLDSFSKLSPEMQTFIIGAGAVAAVIGPIVLGIGGIVGGVGKMVPLFLKIGPGVVAAGKAFVLLKQGLMVARVMALAALPTLVPFLVPLAAIAAAVGLVYLAWKSWDKIEPILMAVKDAIVGWWTENVQPVFNSIGEGIKTVIGIFQEYFGPQLQALIDVVNALISGDFAGAWEAAKRFVKEALIASLRIISEFGTFALDHIKNLYEGVKLWIKDKLGKIWDGLMDKIGAVGEKFKWLWDKVVGNSWIPDLFDGIQKHAARFGPEFVEPVLSGIADVAAGFAGMKFEMPVLSMPTLNEPANDNDSAKDTTETDREPENEIVAEWREGFRAAFTGGVKAALNNDLKGFLTGWFENVGNRALDNILKAASDALFDVFANAFSTSSGSSGGGLAGILGGVFSTLFSGREMGGPVLANHPYVVGEKRPELFVPSTAGRIEPNVNNLQPPANNDGGLGSVTINFNGPVSNPQEVRRSAAQAGAQLLRMSSAGKRGI